MNILFITDLYPIKTNETTTPVTLHNFVIEWIKQGHSVDVIKPNFIFNSFLRGKPFYKDGFYEFQSVRIFNVNYFTPFLFDITKKIKKEDKRIRSVEAWRNDTSPHPRIQASENSYFTSDYDIIIAHMPSGIIFANKLAKIFHIPLVCGVHASDIEILTNPIYKFYFRTQLKNAYKNAKKIACRSFVLQNKFNKMFPELSEKTFVANSGINEDVKRRRGVEAWQNYASTHPRIHTSIMTCANLIKRKNIDKLILAVKDLEGFELNIIGDGKELSRLNLLAQQSKINFLGRLPHKEVLEEMQKSDIFILPSVNETFGMVYLEAMASGCITVCTRNDGVDGIIKDDENGFLCDPSVEGIKETLLKIKNSPNIEKIIENSLKTIKEYTQESCATNYLKQINN